MDLNAITVADFKSRFFRDFPYLPVYSADKLYNTGALVYYSVTELFYTALVDGLEGVAPNSDPTKWELTAGNIDDYVLDQDITNAFAEAKMGLNQGLFATDDDITLGYLYLTAHYLCNDLRASRAGLAAIGAMMVQSRSVGSVSETYAIPQGYLDSPVYAFYLTSAYGLKYLAMVIPALAGNVVAVLGTTRP